MIFEVRGRLLLISGPECSAMINHEDGDKSEISDLNHCDTPGYSPIKQPRDGKFGQNAGNNLADESEASKLNDKSGSSGQKKGLSLAVNDQKVEENTQTIKNAYKYAIVPEGSSESKIQNTEEYDLSQNGQGMLKTTDKNYDPHTTDIALKSELVDNKIEGAIEHQLLCGSPDSYAASDKSVLQRSSQSHRQLTTNDNLAESTHSYHVQLPEHSENNTRKGSNQSLKNPALRSRDKTPYVPTKSPTRPEESAEKSITFAPNSQANLEIIREDSKLESPVQISIFLLIPDDKDAASLTSTAKKGDPEVIDIQKQISFEHRPTDKIELIEYETVKQPHSVGIKSKTGDDAKRDPNAISRADAIVKQSKTAEADRLNSKPISRYLIVD